MMSIPTPRQSAPSSPPRSRPWLALIIALALLAPPGCGDESEGGGSSAGSGDFATLRAEAESARDAAVAAGADAGAADVFAKGTEYLDKAIALEADPQAASKTKAQYQRAKEKFEESVTVAEQRKGKLDEVATRIAEYEKLRDEVKAGGGDVVDPTTFAKAEQNLADARAASAAGDIPKAKREITYAIDDLKIVKRQAAHAEQQKKLADDERALCETEKAKATAAEAEKVTPQDWQWASDQERDALAAYEAKQYERSLALYRQAKNSYLNAATYAVQQKEALANATAKPENGDIGRGDPRESVPKVGEIDIPDIGQQELGLADLKMIFAGAATYKESALEIDWANGDEFEKDIEILAGKPENIRFRGEEHVGMGEGVYENLYVIAGNTVGFVLIDAVFQDGVSVKATVKFQNIAPKGFFEFVMMADDVKNFYASEFATNVKLVDDGNSYVKAKSADATHSKPYGTWVSLTKPYELEVKYYKESDEAQGEVRCYMNGTETCRYPSDKFRKGRVGIRWVGVKFIIKELVVRGLPNEEWAKLALEKHAADQQKGETGKGFGF